MTVRIRNARHADIDTLVRLLIQLFTLETDFTIDEHRQRRGLGMLIDGCGKHRCLQVAEAEGAVVGMGSAQLLISTAEGGPVALIEDIVVDAPWRARGIGRKIMEAIEQWAIQRGVTRLQLLADHTNGAALDFYHHLDWLPTRMVCLRRKLQ